MFNDVLHAFGAVPRAVVVNFHSLSIDPDGEAMGTRSSASRTGPDVPNPLYFKS